MKEESTAALIMAITDLTNAITYMSNVIGHKADDQNPTTEDGKAAVTASAAFKQEVVKKVHEETFKEGESHTLPATEKPKDTPPEAEEKPAINYNIGHVKHALNKLASLGQMEKASAILTQYAGGMDIEKLKEEDYNTVIEECKHAIK